MPSITDAFTATKRSAEQNHCSLSLSQKSEIVKMKAQAFDALASGAFSMASIFDNYEGLHDLRAREGDLEALRAMVRLSALDAYNSVALPGTVPQLTPRLSQLQLA